MKTEIIRIVLMILIIISLVIPQRGFSASGDGSEPTDMANQELTDMLDQAYAEVFIANEISFEIVTPEVMIFDFMDNLILQGNADDELIKKVLRCSDYLSTVTGTDMYKMNTEVPIFKECREILYVK